MDAIFMNAACICRERRNVRFRYFKSAEMHFKNRWELWCLQPITLEQSSCRSMLDASGFSHSFAGRPDSLCELSAVQNHIWCHKSPRQSICSLEHLHLCFYVLFCGTKAAFPPHLMRTRWKTQMFGWGWIAFVALNGHLSVCVETEQGQIAVIILQESEELEFSSYVVTLSAEGAVVFAHVCACVWMCELLPVLRWTMSLSPCFLYLPGTETFTKRACKCCPHP